MAMITLHKDDDPALEQASKKAKATFRYFWRELSWEYRRIIPGLELAAFKVALTDNEETPAEVMWCNEVNFDGYRISGRLLNQPNWLKSIKEGDPVEIPLKALKDWLYAINSVAYGGFTVNAIRKQMGKGERKQHDAAWGMDFGNPDQVHVVPPEWFEENKAKKKGLFGLGKSAQPQPLSDDVLQSKEHPMAANMAESLHEFLSKNTQAAGEIGEDGLNMLHQTALTGSVIGLKAMLECGVDVNLKSKRGHTALDFAKALGWKNAYAFIAKNGGRHAGK